MFLETMIFSKGNFIETLIDDRLKKINHHDYDNYKESILIDLNDRNLM